MLRWRRTTSPGTELRTVAILAAWISRATLEEFFLSQTGWIMHLGAFRDSNPKAG